MYHYININTYDILNKLCDDGLAFGIAEFRPKL